MQHQALVDTHFLKLNEHKTEVIVFTTPSLTAQAPVFSAPSTLDEPRTVEADIFLPL